jgi:hypothetical protein
MEIKKDIDDVSDLEEIESPIVSDNSDSAVHLPHSISALGSQQSPKSEQSPNQEKISSPPQQTFTPFTPYNRDSLDRLRHSIHNSVPAYPSQFSNISMPYSGLALLNQQAIRNHQMAGAQLAQMQNTQSLLGKRMEADYHHSPNGANTALLGQQTVPPIGEPDVRRHLQEIYRKYNIVPKRIQGGTLEEVLRPPLKSQGHRTAHQIHLMRRMREVSSKMNLTDCTNPNYEDAVSVLLDSFEITAPYVNAPDYRRKMNFLLRKRINNRRWFLRKKAKGAAQNDDIEIDVGKKLSDSISPNIGAHPNHPMLPLPHSPHLSVMRDHMAASRDHPIAHAQNITSQTRAEFLPPLLAAALANRNYHAAAAAAVGTTSTTTTAVHHHGMSTGSLTTTSQSHHSIHGPPPSLTIGGTSIINEQSKKELQV